jgi:hypothetical protein
MMYEGTWTHVIVIPCVRGRALASATRRLSSLALAYGTKSPFPYGVPQEAEPSCLKRLAVERWNVEESSLAAVQIAQAAFKIRMLAVRTEDVWSLERFSPARVTAYEAKQQLQLIELASMFLEPIASLRAAQSSVQQDLDLLDQWASNVVHLDLRRNLDSVAVALLAADRIVEEMVNRLTAAA